MKCIFSLLWQTFSYLFWIHHFWISTFSRNFIYEVLLDHFTDFFNLSRIYIFILFSCRIFEVLIIVECWSLFRISDFLFSTFEFPYILIPIIWFSLNISHTIILIIYEVFILFFCWMSIPVLNSPLLNFYIFS